MSETFGERIHAARLKRGLSEGRVAQMIGVAQTTVGRWERDAIRPTGLRLEALAKALNTSVMYLVLGVATPAPKRGRVMHMLASGPAFAEFLDARIVDLQRQVALARAARASLP